MQEFDLIKNYFLKLAINNKSSLDLNDDVFFDKNKKLVISVDTYNEGIHFPDFKNPSLTIKKILRSSLSDLICKGVKPKYYFISASGSKKTFSNNNLTNSILLFSTAYISAVLPFSSASFILILTRISGSFNRSLTLFVLFIFSVWLQSIVRKKSQISSSSFQDYSIEVADYSNNLKFYNFVKRMGV